MSASPRPVVTLRAFLVLLFASAWLAATAGAQAPEQAPPGAAKQATVDDQGNTTYRLTVSPAAEPHPALRYRFLVPPVDQVHGNAATFYYKAMVVDGSDWIFALNADEQMLAHLDTPIDELPLAEIKKKVGDLDEESLRGAARADYCNWEDPIREYGANTLLPQTQKLRGLARGLALFARMQIAEHRHADAIETLRSGYALSRNLGRAPSIVQSLVGMAIQGILNDQTRALIADADSPNLYWALTELASQPVELRQGFSYESRFWEFTIHKLRDLDQRALSPRESLDLVKALYESQLGSDKPSAKQWGPETELAVLSTALSIEPAARAYLVEQGYAAADVDAMPVLQRAVLYRWRQFAEVRDNYFKWALLPETESGERTSRFAAQELVNAGSDAGTPFSEFLSADAQIFTASFRHQRDVNMLRVVEALRMHAAQHGVWPQSLADVTVVPVPLDPTSQKPFEYSVAAGVATLYAPPKQPVSPGLPAVRYELTLVRKSKPGK